MLSKTLSTISQTESLLHSSIFGHTSVTHDTSNTGMKRPATPSQVVVDFPSWTPLQAGAQEEEESLSAPDQEVDDLAARKGTDSAMERAEAARSGPPTNAQATAENTVTGRTLDPPSDAKPTKVKKARFDGVFIATKPRPYRKLSAQTQSGRADAASSAQPFSLVDALARTFNANRHPKSPSSRPSRPGLRQPDDASTAPQTDVETTEAEDDHLQLNTRLVRTPLRRRPGGRVIVSANATETNSEDALAQPERPAKRLRTILYEANVALIDKALGTVQAPVSWDAEMDIITRDDDVMTSAQAVLVHVSSMNDRTGVDADTVTASSLRSPAPVSAQTSIDHAWRMPNPMRHWQQPVLSPYQCRGAKFRQRLDAAFGANATVRTDKTARPRPVSPPASVAGPAYNLADAA